jgi:hypothetical protein
MTLPHILTWPTMDIHDSRREGIRLGLIVATATWLWLAVIDAAVGQPFHTFQALGGVVAFTAVHYALCVMYGLVLISVVHGAERAPSLVIALFFGVITLEGAFAMMTNLLATVALGSLAWLGVFGGSLIGTAVAMLLLSRTHPLATYLQRAEDET